MSLTLIETKTLGASSASIEFTSIPQDGTDLVIFASVKENNADADSYIKLQLNSADPSSVRNLYGTGSGVGSNTANHAGATAGSGGSTTNTYGSGFIYIPNYTSGVNKSASADGVGEGNQTNTPQMLSALLFTVTAAVTSVKLIPFFGGNWQDGSTVSLYKITKGTDGIVTSS